MSHIRLAERFKAMDNRRLALTKPHFKTTIFKSFLSYLRHNYPSVKIEEIISQTGLDLDYFLNETNWVSVEVERKFVAACYAATADKNLSFNVGKTALSKDNVGALTYHLIKHVIPFSEIFDRLPKMIALANRVFSVKTIRGSSQSVDIEYTIDRSVVSDYEFQLLTDGFPSIMENIRGYFHALMALKGCEMPKIDYHIEIASDGSPIARFRVVYSSSRSFGVGGQLALATLFGGGFLGATIFFGEITASVMILRAGVIFPLAWLAAILINFFKLRTIAKDTERSLNLLDSRYTELHQVKVQLTEQLSESKLINEISSAFLKVADENSLLKAACEGLIQHIGFNRVILLLYDEKQEKLVFRVSAGVESDKLKKLFGSFSLNLTRVNVSENAISSVFRSGRPILVSDVKKYLGELTEGESKRALLESGSTGFACTPIHTGTLKIGVMLADVTDSAVVLNQDKLRLLSIVANQMAIFIEKQRAKQSLVEAYESEVRLAAAYSRFVPMETLEMLNYSSVHDVKIGDGVEKNMAVVFSDIREFTSLCETMSPSEVLKFLNSYYSRLAPIVKGHNGIVDKFVGDGLMAIFSNFEDAAKAAIAMQRELVRYNLEKRVGRRRTLVAGIGIAKGPVIFGPLGEDKRLQLTVLSDSVNLASRLDGLCSQFNARIMISDSALDEIPRDSSLRLRDHGSTPVKGKSKNVNVYELVDLGLLDGLSAQFPTEDQQAYLQQMKTDLQRRSENAVHIDQVVSARKSA